MIINKKPSKNKLKVVIVVWVGIIIYFFWNLYLAVSKLQIKLLNIESLAEYTRDICNFHYVIAIVFLVLGVFLGLGIAAFKKKWK